MNELHRSLADRIIRHIRTSALDRGAHLTEARLQDLFGTSRQPIRTALAYLAEQGILEQQPHKGFFLIDPDCSLPQGGFDAESGSEEAIYLSIAEDRLNRSLPERVSENDLMRRYTASRTLLRRILTRISGEGWIERNEGRGWTFAALIDSVEAYRECYDLRQVVEVHGLLAPGFRADPHILADLRRRQERVAESGWQKLTQMELFQTNSDFHEGLAALSGNRFVQATVEKLNQLRRLVEYRQTLNRDHIRAQNREHLAILTALEQGENATASALLHQHLGQARSRKARADLF